MWRPINVPTVRFHFVDKNGCDIEWTKGHPIISLLRILLNTRRILTRPWWLRAGYFYVPYIPLFVTEPPDLSQKGFMSSAGYKIINNAPIMMIGLVGPIGGGDDETKNMMKPEE